jgi:hypothetical protein
MVCWCCIQCWTLIARHRPVAAVYKPWTTNGVTSVFQKALRLRRDKQAAQIISHFSKTLGLGKVIDYGCGQGAFVCNLLDRGIDAIGTDISLEGCDADIPDGRFVPLQGEWAIPNHEATTFCLLDVLEHSRNPVAFLKEVHTQEFQYLLIKVPLFSGPIALIARVLVIFGRTALLRQLLLTGEISPHYVFLRQRGLINTAAAAGFILHGSLRIADVGKELPERLRGNGAALSILRPFLVVVGWMLEAVAPLWSDTEVFLFRKT